jgi:drug/metabolite transporter (DMT)-like permease
VRSDKLIRDIGTIRFTCISMIISGVAVMVHYTVVYGFEFFSFPYQVYLLGVGVAVVGTVLPSFLMTKGIELIGSSNMAIIASIGPIATIFLSDFILDERISAMHVAGTILVLAGVMIISLKGNKGTPVQ